jgi:ubiquitin-small subunit ribosomal protein S27Ae
MAKARVGLYTVQGEELTRTHKSCPKCGPGVFLAEHGDRRSCGRCGYSESKGPPAPKAKPAKAPGEPKPAAARGSPAAPSAAQ